MPGSQDTNDADLLRRPGTGAREAGDPLVTFGYGLQFRVTDDVLDACERPISGTFEHFTQNCVGRVPAIHPHDLRRRRQPQRFITLERLLDAALAGERIAKGTRVENRLSRAI